MNRETADAVDAAGRAIANAILPTGICEGHDAAGGKVESLTEATMGITAGLVRIAEAIDRLASAVEDINQK